MVFKKHRKYVCSTCGVIGHRTNQCPRQQMQAGTRIPARRIEHIGKSEAWYASSVARRLANGFVKDNAGFGDCQFHAVVDGLASLSVNTSVVKLRHMIGVHIMENLRRYNESIFIPPTAEEVRVALKNGTHLSSDVTEFAQNIQNGREWGTEASLVALAELLPAIGITLYSTDLTNPIEWNTDSVPQIFLCLKNTTKHYVAIIPGRVNVLDEEIRLRVQEKVDPGGFPDEHRNPNPFVRRPRDTSHGDLTDGFPGQDVPRSRKRPHSIVNFDEGLVTNCVINDYVPRKFRRIDTMDKIPRSHCEEYDLFGPWKIFDDVVPQVFRYDENECANCARRSSEMYNLDIIAVSRRVKVTYEGKLKRNMKPPYLLCEDCRRHVKGKRSWSDQGPASIWSLLTGSDVQKAQSVWNVLPTEIRFLWRSVAGRLIDTTPLTRDVTADVREWQRLTKMNTAGSLRKRLQKFPYPNIRCPAGDWEFIERTRRIPFHHFLARKFDIVLYNANKDRLRGMRPDYPCEILSDLGQVVSAAIVIDPIFGLCILACQDHENIQNEFVHVAVHPTIGMDPVTKADLFAALVPVPHITCRPKLRLYNPRSYASVVFGGSNGLSSSSFSADPISRGCCDDRTAIAQGLTLRYRPDIADMTRRRTWTWSSGDEVLLEHEQNMRLHDSTSEDDVEKALRGCTVFDKTDVFHHCHVINGRDTKRDAAAAEESWRSKFTDVTHFLLKVVHPLDSHGHEPFDTQKLIQKSGDLARMTSIIGVHVRRIQQGLIDRYMQAPSEDLSKLLSLIQDTAGQLAVRKAASWLPTALQRKLEALPIGGACNAERVSKILVSMLPNAKSSPGGAAEMQPDNTLWNAGIVFVYRTSSRRSRNTDVELPHTVGRHHLLMCWSDNNKTSDFRWSERRQFWRVNEKGTQRLNHAYAVPQAWNLLIYVKPLDLEVMEEDCRRGLGCQNVVSCKTHEMFLAKEARDTFDIPCSVGNCNATRLALRCIHGLSSGSQCTAGVCRKHSNEFQKKKQPMQVSALFHRAPVGAGSSSDGEDDEHLEMESQEANNRAPSVELENLHDIIFSHAEATMNAMEEEYTTPIHSRLNMPPIFDEERQRNYLKGHLIHNGKFSLMRRRKYDGYVNNKTKQYLQHLVSVMGEASSLQYFEANCFPNMFWYMNPDGGIPGALVSPMLSDWGSDRKPRGFATLNDHVLLRMRDHTLNTSRNVPYIHQMFDFKLNTLLSGNSSAMFFKRGPESLDKTGVQYENTSFSMPFDEDDSSAKRKELAQLLGKGGAWRIFWTGTLSMTGTPGVAEVMELIKRASDGSQKREEELFIANTVLLNRCWERTARLLMEYITTSPEQPCGPIKNYFWRFEFQDQKGASAGNFAHIHAGFTVPEETARSLNRICCKSDSIFTQEFSADPRSLIEAGLCDDLSDFYEVEHIIKTVQNHSCEAAGSRCKKRWSSEGNAFVCRVPRHPPSIDSWFERKQTMYSAEDIELLRELDFVEDNPRLDGGIAGEREPIEIFMHPKLDAGRWHYPALAEERFSPFIPFLGLFLRGSTNAQVCDEKFMFSYLLKYIEGKEERRDVHGKINMGKNSIRLEEEEHCHQKITGQACAKKKRDAKSNVVSSSRTVSFLEMATFTSGMEYSQCSADFIAVNTNPPEARPVMKKRRGNFKRLDHATGPRTHPLIQQRKQNDIPDWRRFTVEQEEMIAEQWTSDYHADKIERFSLRAPELHVFDDLQKFHEFFSKAKIRIAKETLVVESDLRKQPWIDGTGMKTLVNFVAIGKACEFLREKEDDHRAAILLKEIFIPLEDMWVRLIDVPVPQRAGFAAQLITKENRDLLRRFVDATVMRERFAVISEVKPSNREKFHHHLCLTLGRYITEREVFAAGSFPAAYEKCGLVKDHEAVTSVEINAILCRFAMEQAFHWGISTREMMRHLHQAKTVIWELFRTSSGYMLGIPKITLAAIQAAANERILKIESERKERLLVTLHGLMLGMLDLPPIEAFRNASMESPLDWVPVIRSAPGQTDESLREQSEALEFCLQQMRKYTANSREAVKFPLVNGLPGTGKTHLINIAVLYAISKGLRVTLMSLTAERAQSLGGEHIHMVFPLDVKSFGRQRPILNVQSCLSKLGDDDDKRILLKRNHVFVFEEIGFISMELFDVLDMTMRKLSDCDLPFGGKFVMGNGDHRQIPPVDGRPMWMSFHLLSSFRVACLTEMVRCARDEHLRTVLLTVDKPQPSTEEVREAVDIIMREATHYLSWGDVPPDCIRIVSMRKAEKDTTEEYLRSVKDRRGLVSMECLAVDEIQNGDSWQPVFSSTEERRISHFVTEDCKLMIFEGAIMRVTYNDRSSNPPLSQGQLVIVEKIINKELVSVRVMPPGERLVTVVNPNWPVIRLSPRYSHSVVIGSRSQKGRRRQFGLKHHVATTIHKSQGQTFHGRMATQVSISDKKYHVWEREMLMVLLSRNTQLADIGFVGPENETREALQVAMSLPSKWRIAIDQRLRCLNVLGRMADASNVVEYDSRIHQLCTEIPESNHGFVYQLISGADSATSYVGETVNLHRRLMQHNTGHGSKTTNQVNLHPWYPFAFVLGFASENSRLEFETSWHREIRPHHSPMNVYILGKTLAAEFNSILPREEQIIVVQSAEVRNT